MRPGDAPADLSPESSLCIHEMLFFDLKNVELLVGGKGRGGYELHSLIMTTLL